MYILSMLFQENLPLTQENYFACLSDDENPLSFDDDAVDEQNAYMEDVYEDFDGYEDSDGYDDPDCYEDSDCDDFADGSDYSEDGGGNDNSDCGSDEQECGQEISGVRLITNFT